MIYSSSTSASAAPLSTATTRIEPTSTPFPRSHVKVEAFVFCFDRFPALPNPSWEFSTSWSFGGMGDGVFDCIVLCLGMSLRSKNQCGQLANKELEEQMFMATYTSSIPSIFPLPRSFNFSSWTCFPNFLPSSCLRSSSLQLCLGDVVSCTPCESPFRQSRRRVG
jgi:hypothetical protein